jgi:hypothetical protein
LFLPTHCSAIEVSGLKIPVAVLQASFEREPKVE